MRVLRNSALGAVAGSFVLAGSGAAFAGAWDAMGVGSLELLFAPEKFVVEGGTTYLDRNVNYKVKSAKSQLGAPVSTGSDNERVTPNIWNYQVGIKASLTDKLDCLGRILNPFGITEEMDPTWQGRYAGYSTKADTLKFDATCSYKFQVDEASNFRVIAGVKAMELTYASDSMVHGQALKSALASSHPDIAAALDPTKDYVTESELTSDGMAVGWRAGVAYEIPAYALRASLIYGSKVDFDLTGESNISAEGHNIPGDIFASLTLPQSVELNVQSGIAPGWLATFGVKWMDWSVVDRLIVVDAKGDLKTDRKLAFKDGWTVKAGIGHQYNEKLALGSSVQWDRGVGGSYSDTYTFGLGGSYALNEKMKVTIGGAAIYKTSGAGDANNLISPGGSENNYEYDSSWVYAVNTKIRVAF